MDRNPTVPGRVLVGLACGVLLTLGVTSNSALAASASAGYRFYKGKTVNLIVPYKPGGHFDRMARVVAHFMVKQLGAKQIRVINRPGGAAIVGTNKVYNAKPDGLTFGITPGAGVIISQIAQVSGVSYDVRKFNWLGEPGSDPEVLWTHKQALLH